MKPTTKELFICGVKWTVVFQDTPVLVSERVVYGYTDADKLKIVIGIKGIAEEQIHRTLIHEIFHSVIDMTVVTHKEDEEECVAGFECGVFSIIRCKSNRWLFEMLRAGA